MKRFSSTMMVLVILAYFSATPSIAQQAEMPKPGPEFKVFQADVGTWDVKIKVWQGPGEPTISKGKETNRMLGGFWMLTDFEGNMMGMDFQGHGMYSYDADRKHYVGTWVDSLSATKMDMIGKHDQAHHTLTYEGIGPGPDGSPTKHVMTTKYRDDGTRLMTMEMQAGTDMVKIFEMDYSKAK